VPELRRLIGLSDLHLGKGKFRSAISYRVCKRGTESEENLERELIDYFGEPFVHIEKPIGQGHRRIRYDFFIYAKNYKFAVDIFWSETRQNIMKNLDSKINSYQYASETLYLVMANPNISQEALDEITKSKRIKPIPKNAKLITLNNFLRTLKDIEPLKII